LGGAKKRKLKVRGKGSGENSALATRVGPERGEGKKCPWVKGGTKKKSGDRPRGSVTLLRGGGKGGAS